MTTTPTDTKIEEFTIRFGKHKGRRFKDVDDNYLRWCNERGIFDNDEYKWNKPIREYIAVRCLNF